MVSLIGEYDATVDVKGRFLLPTGLRKQLPEDHNSFVINRGFESCLVLYPVSSWEPIFKQIKSLNEFDPKAREFRRYFLNGAQQLELDSAGRLLLPKNLTNHASIEKDIVLVSAVDKIEIWDKNKYQKFFDSFSPESFSRLASEVMGDSSAEKD
ncbi:MAG: division/cell wall cluster transcriptional repressor MraZ [Bacteroidetes bacterium]|nr:division/cell wall cluster transcriptional repressor MraZ [Bacteroidota bacterium]